MKQASIILAVLDVLLLSVAFIVCIQKDRTCPVISFDQGENIYYQEGMNESELLKGVTATDNRDGDVTERIVIEKIAETGENQVIVTYVVTDQSNNVGKAGRTILLK